MNFVDISVFYDEAATRISGAPLDLLRAQLAATMREFYVKSGAFVLKSPAVAVVAGQADYNLDAQAEGAVLTVLGVQLNDRNVAFHGNPNTPGLITLRNVPGTDEAAALTAWLSLRPFEYDTIPEETYNYDFDTIISGLCGRMYAMPDRPWSNPPQAAYYLKQFRQGQSQARVRVKSNYTQADAGWQFPAWA